MSNRVKVKPNRLGRPQVDAFYPVVCTPDTADAGAQLAITELERLAGFRKVGKTEVRIYHGSDVVLEVMATLAEAGAVPDIGRYETLTESARTLGNQAVLMLASARMLAPKG